MKGLQAFEEIKYQIGNIQLHSHEPIPQPILITLTKSGLLEVIEDELKVIDILRKHTLEVKGLTTKERELLLEVLKR